MSDSEFNKWSELCMNFKLSIKVSPPSPNLSNSFPTANIVPPPTNIMPPIITSNLQ